MEHVRSAALNFLVPAGCVYDPPEQLGIASVLAELITRGAGVRDSRELSLALDTLGLDRRGTVQGIESLTIKNVQAHYRRLFQPRGTIMSVAGNIDWKPLRDQVERLFGDWKPANEPQIKLGPQPTQHAHIAKETT